MELEYCASRVSILLESYCNFRPLCFVVSFAGYVSILLESYCNTAKANERVLKTISFNSSRVLLQLMSSYKSLDSFKVSILLESYCNDYTGILKKLLIKAFQFF